MMEPIYGKNNKEELPLQFYLEKFRALDPAETATRCGLNYDGEQGGFTLCFLGEEFTVSHPDFTVVGPRALSNPEKILFLRYLVDGRYVIPGGRFLTYRELPWGEVYLRQFTGRCIQRFARTYGSDPEPLKKAMEQLPAQSVAQSDAGWDLTLLPGLTIRFLLWLGDEEFPPNAQILFSDNFTSAFTAEDLANAGDIVLNRMRALGR